MSCVYLPPPPPSSIEVCRAGEIRFHQQRRAHELFYACEWRVCECVRQCVRSEMYAAAVNAPVASSSACVRARGLSEKDGCAGSCVRELIAVYKMAADGLKRWGARTRRSRRLPGRQSVVDVPRRHLARNLFTCGGDRVTIPLFCRRYFHDNN